MPTDRPSTLKQYYGVCFPSNQTSRLPIWSQFELHRAQKFINKCLRFLCSAEFVFVMPLLHQTSKTLLSKTEHSMICTKYHTLIIWHWGFYTRSIYSFLRCLFIFCGILAFNTRTKNKLNCLHWLYLITATCFGPYLGPSSNSFIKYVSRYWNILIWININVTQYNHNTCNYY
jgi:hypothetical protein